MKRQETIRLEFASDRERRPILQRTELQVGGEPPLTAVAVNPNTGPGFVWDLHRGFPRVLALMLVRVARWRFHDWPAEARTLPIAVGTARPCAATRFGDLAALTNSGWLAETLSPRLDKRDAHARLNRWFAVHHVHGRPGQQPPSVELRLDSLTPGDVEVWFEGSPATASRLDWIETRLAAAIDGSLPPLPAGARHRLAGYLPSVGPDFWERDRELEAITDHYRNPRCRLLEIVAGGGEGKTALARAWLRQGLGDGSLRESLIFSWSFYRQGYSRETRQSLWVFYRALGEALGVEVREGMLPRKLLATLLAGLRATPALLLLDGLEVLLSRSRPAVADAPVATFQDATMAALLTGLAGMEEGAGGFALLTTRESVAPGLTPPPAALQRLPLPRLPLPQALTALLDGLEATEPAPGTDDRAEALTVALHLGLAGGDAASFARLPAAVPSTGSEPPEIPVRLLRTVRRGLEKLGASPEQCLLVLASLFDRPAEWEAIVAVIRSEAGAGRLTAPWRSLPIERWEEARERLQELGWIQPSADGLVPLHPLVQRCLAEDLRRAMPEAWIEAHRRLCDYFASLPEKHLPDTLEEMEPLLRASWHGCQAGDFQRVYREIARPRISREHEAYIVFAIGAYEDTINLVNLFTEDGESFPGRDLDEGERIEVAHACGICLRYLDRLDEALHVETGAWQRARKEPGHNLLPIAINLLRLQHIFGKLNETGPALRSLLQGIFSGRGEELKGVSEAFLANAMGYAIAIAALVLAGRGNTTSARAILSLALALCRRHGSTNRHLVAPMGAPFHALALLEMGEWKTVAAARDAGELETPFRRYVDTGFHDYLRGRLLAAEATTRATREAALAPLHDCLQQAESNGFKWWRASALLEIGKLQLALGANETGQAALATALELSTEHDFHLVAIDTRLALAAELLGSGEMRTAHDRLEQVARDIAACGYGLRRAELQRLQKIASATHDQ